MRTKFSSCVCAVVAAVVLGGLTAGCVPQTASSGCREACDGIIRCYPENDEYNRGDIRDILNRCMDDCKLDDWTEKYKDCLMSDKCSKVKECEYDDNTGDDDDEDDDDDDDDNDDSSE